MQAELAMDYSHYQSAGSTSSTLLEAANHQDAEAWRKISRLYGPIVFRWCRRASLQPADALDISQDVMTAVYTNLGRFERGSFRGWLWRITRNKIIDAGKRVSARLRAQGGSDHQDFIANVSEHTPPTSEKEEKEQILKTTLEIIRDDFSPQTWQVFERLTLDNASVKEIAAEFELSESAVKMAKFRVLSRLKEELQEW